MLGCDCVSNLSNKTRIFRFFTFVSRTFSKMSAETTHNRLLKPWVFLFLNKTERALKYKDSFSPQDPQWEEFRTAIAEEGLLVFIIKN